MKRLLLPMTMIVTLFTAVAGAQTTNNGSLALTGEVQGSITMSFHQHTDGGFTLNSGDGTGTAAASLSTVSMYGTADGIVAGTNFVKSSQANGFTLTGPVDIQVDKANVTSDGFNLTAQLQTADSSEWTLAGTSLSSSSPASVVTGGTYAVRTPLTLAVKFPSSMNAAAVTNTINFVVTAQ